VLSSVKPQLDEMKIGLIAVGLGTAFMAKNFQQECGFLGELFVDQKKEVYGALGCNRGLKYVLSMKTLKAVKLANKEGYEGGKNEADVLQLGGTFVISRTKGLLWQKMEEWAGDHPELVDVVQACKDAANQK